MPKARTTRKGFTKRAGRSIRNAMVRPVPPKPRPVVVDPNGFTQDDIDKVIAAQAKRSRRQERNLRYAQGRRDCDSHATVETTEQAV